MTRYALLSEVDGWLSQNGYDRLLDENADGTVDSGEQSTYGSAALEYASALIDGYIQDQVDPVEARAQTAALTASWLKDRCIDLTVWRIAGVGGRDIPESMQLAYDNTIKLLEDIQSGAKIPGYTYPGLVNSVRNNKRPMVTNL